MVVVEADRVGSVADGAMAGVAVVLEIVVIEVLVGVVVEVELLALLSRIFRRT